MTTAERLRSYWGERELDRGQLVSLAVRYWQVALIIAIIGLAAGLRLWGLGDRAIHHDESIHIKFAWDISEQGVSVYKHDPTYHGPFQYFGTAATFILFGDSDYTSRLFPALFGIALAGLPFLLRKQLGTLGAFVAAGLIAVSPALLYFSRFARNDIYVAFFTLGMVVCMWRYLQDRKEGWLIAIAPLLALSFAAKEVTFIIAGVLLVYLDIMLAIDIVQKIRSEREMTPVQLALAYLVVTPTAWLIAASWPVTEGWRKTFNLTEIPATAPILLILGTLAAPQFAPAIQSLGVENHGYMGEDNVMRWSVLLLILGGAYVGVLWNWRVWLIAGALFYGIYVLLFTSFFTNMGGFWTGIWGSMDYWLEQQDVRRGDQPDYYYFMLLPIYEFLPLIFGLAGALYYAFRGKMEQKLLAASAVLLILTFSVLPDSAPLIGDYRIHMAFVIAIGAVIVLSMDGFTKFLLFWTLSILFGLTVAGEKMPWLTVHLALPLALLGAKIVDDIFSSMSLKLEEGQDAERGFGRAGPSTIESLLGHPLAQLALGAAFATIAAVIFQAVGPGSGLSIIAWALALAAAALVVWVARRVSWTAAGQVAGVALFGALLVFTIRAGSGAAFDQGDPNAVPPEMFIYAQGSPGLNVILGNIERVGAESGNGKDLKIVIDNSVNIWPWPWYMRHYRNVEYNGFEEGYVPPAGAVVLVSDANQGTLQPVLDQYNPPIPYTHMWWFPELYKGLQMGDFFQDIFDGDLLHRWRLYMGSRTVERATSSPNMLAFFPIEYSDISVPPPTPGQAGPSEPLPADSVTVLGTAGQDLGGFSQPAGLVVDAQGNLYVVDTLHHRIQRLAPDGTWTAFGEEGSDPGQFGNPRTADYAVDDGPWGIGVDADGFIYVADTWNHRIQKFTPDFELVPDWVIGDMFGPRDIAVTANGELLISDTGNNRLMLYNTDGELIRTFGAQGGGRGEFSEPAGLAIAPNGDIYVADYWNKRIQHFDASLQEIGVIEVDSWGSQGITDRAYIAALADGRVLATDPANHRIIVFDAAGEEEAAWTLSSLGSSRPVGIAVDAAGAQVYISDGATGQVVRVQLSAFLAPQGTTQLNP